VHADLERARLEEPARIRAVPDVDVRPPSVERDPRAAAVEVDDAPSRPGLEADARPV
jgi:hypothetical protein